MGHLLTTSQLVSDQGVGFYYQSMQMVRDVVHLICYT